MNFLVQSLFIHGRSIIKKKIDEKINTDPSKITQ